MSSIGLKKCIVGGGGCTVSPSGFSLSPRNRRIGNDGGAVGRFNQCLDMWTCKYFTLFSQVKLTELITYSQENKECIQIHSDVSNTHKVV